MEDTPSFPPPLFPKRRKSHFPHFPPALAVVSGLGTGRATCFPGDGVTDSLQEEKRVKMGDQMKIPMGMWGWETPHRPPHTPSAPSLATRGSKHCSALCPQGDFPQKGTALCSKSLLSPLPALTLAGCPRTLQAELMWWGRNSPSGQVLSMGQEVVGGSQGWGVPAGLSRGDCPGVKVHQWK